MTSRTIWVYGHRGPGRQAAYLKANAIACFGEDCLETCFDLARAGVTPIVSPTPGTTNLPFPGGLGLEALARLLFEEKGERAKKGRTLTLTSH